MKTDINKEKDTHTHTHFKKTNNGNGLNQLEAHLWPELRQKEN